MGRNDWYQLHHAALSIESGCGFRIPLFRGAGQTIDTSPWWNARMLEQKSEARGRINYFDRKRKALGI